MSVLSSFLVNSQGVRFLLTWVSGFLFGVQKPIDSTSTCCTFSLNKQPIQFFSVFVTSCESLLHSPGHNSPTSPSMPTGCCTLSHLCVYFLLTQTSLKDQITKGPGFPWRFSISSLGDAYNIPWAHCCVLIVYFWILQLCNPWNTK